MQLRKYYRLGLTWTSNAIEGSSYTESETKILLEDGITVAGKTLRETMAALGHAKAYDYMFTLIGKKGVSEQDILAMHGMLDGGMETWHSRGVQNNRSIRHRNHVQVSSCGRKFPS